MSHHSEEYTYWETLLRSYPFFQDIRADLFAVVERLAQGFRAGHRLFLCGNGGSMADCQHISGELLKSFCRKRPLLPEQQAAFAAVEGGDFLAERLERGLPCHVLGLNHSLASAIQNDYEDDRILYAQELYNLGQAGDMLLGISTSGNARNVLYAVATAQALGMATFGLTGASGGKLARAVDISIKAPGTIHYTIQEHHIIIYHALCWMLEARFFSTAK